MKKAIALLVLAATPALAFAQTPLNNINDVANRAVSIGNLVVGLLISASVVWIIINVVRYLVAGSSENRKEGGIKILWGIVGLVVILSIWGLVYIVKQSFTTQDATPTQDLNNIALPPAQLINGVPSH